MSALIASVPCPGCQTKNSVAADVPSPNGKTTAHTHCVGCKSLIHSEFRRSKTNPMSDIEIKSRLKTMSTALAAILAERSLNEKRRTKTMPHPVAKDEVPRATPST